MTTTAPPAAATAPTAGPARRGHIRLIIAGSLLTGLVLAAVPPWSSSAADPRA